MNELQQTLRHIIDRTNAKNSGDGNSYLGLCPAHEDRNPSLSLTLGDNKILLNCHAGCSFDGIVSAVGMNQSQFFVHSDNSKTPQKKEVCRYRYEKKDGKHAFDVVRLEPKTFRPQRPDGKWSLEGVERVPYSLPELLQGVKDLKLIILLEGEFLRLNSIFFCSKSSHK